MTERSASRLSWVEDGRDHPAALTTWLVGVVGCALAAALAAWWAPLGEPAYAAGAALILTAGAVTGRVLRLDQLFGTTGAWMWAIGAATLAVLVGFPNPALGAAFGLFVLPLDWRLIPRLRAAVGAGLVFATLAILGRGSTQLPVLALWAALAVLTLLLLERDVRRTGLRAGRPPLPGPPPAPRPNRTLRDALTTTTVAAVAVTLAVTFVPPTSPSPAAGRAGNGGLGDPTYWGFGGELDMGVREARGDEIVLRVRADTAALWRGDTYERFDGRTWTQRGSGLESLRGRDRFVVPDAVRPESASVVPPVATDEQVQVFTFERGGNDLVFGANRARTVLASGPASWSPASDAVRLDRPLGRGGSYTVISERPRVTEDLLRSLDTAQSEARRQAAAQARATSRPDPFAPFLAVPPSTTGRTRELAAEVTAGSVTAIDRIRALERWLGAHMRYRLDIPPLPAGRDAVDQFLFEDRQGYCEQIAAALAVLLRTVGVPTRLAVGFVGDERDPVSGEWIVRERNAHAWVEIWWPGVGWQGFDPTAGVPLAPDEGASTPGDRLAAVGPVLRIAAAGALVVGIVHAARILVRKRRRPRPSWVEEAVARLDRAGARAGRPRRPDETLLEYVDTLDAGALAGVGAPALGRALSQATFSGDGDGPGDAGAAATALAVIEQAARERTRAPRPWRRVNPPGSG